MNVRRLVLRIVGSLCAPGGCLAVLAAALLVMLALAGSASAKEVHFYSSSFGGDGSTDGLFIEPTGVAVNDETEDVYVLDKGNNRVERFAFNPSTKAYEYIGQFNGAAAPTGAFSSPEGIAIDNSGDPLLDASAGDVYVVDAGHDVVDKFSATGEYLGELKEPQNAPTGVAGVAVDPSGNVWVYFYDSQAVEFDDEGVSVPGSSFNTARTVSPGLAVDSLGHLYVITESRNARRITPPEPEGDAFVETSKVTGVAVDESTGAVFADEGGEVVDYGQEGKHFEEAFGLGQLTSDVGLAVDSGNGRLYVADAAADEVDVFSALTLADTTAEAPSGESPTDMSTISATLHGTVDPDGLEVSACQFEYRSQDEPEYGHHSAACSHLPGSSTAPGPVEATVEDLEPNTTYHYRLVATDINGTNDGTNGSEETFTTIGAGIREETVLDVASGSATFAAKIDPNESSTSYYFQYGKSGAYEASVPAPPGPTLGSGSANVEVSEHVQGLEAGIVYHYRVVALSNVEVSLGSSRRETSTGQIRRLRRRGAGSRLRCSTDVDGRWSLPRKNTVLNSCRWTRLKA
jgi:DNA-binding beta-propeller fold protein YncE